MYYVLFFLQPPRITLTGVAAPLAVARQLGFLKALGMGSQQAPAHASLTTRMPKREVSSAEGTGRRSPRGGG